MKISRIVAVPILVSILLSGSSSFAGGEETTGNPYRSGSLRLGAFWITQFETSVVARANGIPFGVYIDLNRDIGLTDSVVIPRGIFKYRFSRRHQINLEFFHIRRNRTVVIDREIQLGGDVVPIDATVDAFSRVKIYKGSYTWIFHDSDKVSLGATFGLNVIDFTLGLDVDPVNQPDFAIEESTGVTAPLPILGLRIAYLATQNLALIAASDTLVVEYGAYNGTYLDAYALIDWRFAKHFSIGGGVNFLNLDLKVDDTGVIAELRHNYRGVTGFLGVHF